MAEQSFRSPGFFDREIDLSGQQQSPSGVPAGVVGTAVKGPAFVPVTLGSVADFETRFGAVNPDRPAGYAVAEFLKERNALTFVRVLGAGANKTVAEFANTRGQGIVKNAGFVVTGTRAVGLTAIHDQVTMGAVQFIVGAHAISASLEPIGFPIFTDNSSFENGTRTTDTVNLVRGIVFLASGTRMQVLDGTGENYAENAGSVANPNGTGHTFKLVLSSTAGAAFGAAIDAGALSGHPGIKIFTASLDPNSSLYIAKSLNTDPRKFQQKQHLLYNHFPVAREVAALTTLADGVNRGGIGAFSGSTSTSMAGAIADSFRDLFGRYDTRFTTPSTTPFISQPFGDVEYDLFRVETISDGAFSNVEYKVSIANISPSMDPGDPYGTFELQVRKFDDTDTDRQIVERWPNLNLNVTSDRCIARVVGDKKVYFNFDAPEDERRLVLGGAYPNQSSRIRVIMSQPVLDGDVPAAALPFGFRGIPVPKTSDTLTDTSTALSKSDGTPLGSRWNGRRLTGWNMAATVAEPLTCSIVPPLPYRFTIYRGAMTDASAILVGMPTANARVDSRYYWGVQNTQVPKTGSFAAPTNAVLRANEGTQLNQIVNAYTKFSGITQLDTVVTGAGADRFNNNKFTLARVALSAKLSSAGHITELTGTAKEHMREAAYIRNGTPIVSASYIIRDPITPTVDRITLATLLASSSAVFNQYSTFAKFTNIFYGGFDGLNILSENQFLMNDQGSSTSTPDGLAGTAATNIGLGFNTTGPLLAAANPAGSGSDNNAINSYRGATTVITEPLYSAVNILAIPGIREPLVTNLASSRAKDNGTLLYLMDIEQYDADTARVFTNGTARPSVRQTLEQFEARAVDNSFSATYFPDVFLNDATNNRVVKVPSSVPALGALATTDRVAYPWFAPAGFNRASLANVSNVDVRLTAQDRDDLYVARINPIATFPTAGFVIFGQKTLQMAQSALDRINVRRMLLEIKRLIGAVGKRLLFEQNNQATRSRFVAEVTPLLAGVQAAQGINQFKIVMDDSNNSQTDVENNRLNGRIVVVPTRAIEYIFVDFIITNAGVSFE